MGDRANFGFKDRNGDVIVLYGHWAGFEMMSQLANAIEAARPRWNDEAYATRIAISNLVGDSWRETTGWGLSINSILDNEHKIPVVDWLSATVSLHEEAPWSEDGNGFKVRGMQDEPIFTMEFEAFLHKYKK